VAFASVEMLTYGIIGVSALFFNQHRPVLHSRRSYCIVYTLWNWDNEKVLPHRITGPYHTVKQVSEHLPNFDDAVTDSLMAP
jgi:hypothetical protein